MKQILTEWRRFLNERSVDPGYYPPQFSAMIKKLQDLNAERLNDCEELIKLRTDIRTWTANKLM